MKNKIIYLLAIIFVLGLIFYFYSYLHKNIEQSKIETVQAADHKIEGGTWSTSCTGSADSLHDGNTLTGVTCSTYQEINWDFGGNYGDIFRVRIYSSDGDGANSYYQQCWYQHEGIGFNCSTYGYNSWSLVAGAFSGPLEPGWNNEDITSTTRSKLKLIITPALIPSFSIEEIEVYYSGAAPTPPPTTPPPTPTPSGSGTATPTPSGSITSTPTPSGSGDPSPITDCPNPPCVQNPDDPIFTPDANFNLTLEVPNGGEKWQTGTKHKIKWKYTDDEKRIKKFALFLSKDDGKNFRQVIEQGINKEKKEYEWDIPDDKNYATKEARVLVAAYGDSIDRPLLNDKSDHNFRIYAKDEGFISDETADLPLLIIALILLALGSLAVLWPLILNFLLNNSFMTDLLNRLPLLTAPTMGNKKSTGVVYDSATQSPIIKAVVRIFNVENNKQLESIITNQKGEFSFLVPNGSYYLTVNSTNYDFPSKRQIDSRWSLPRAATRGGNDMRGGNDNTFTPGVSDGVYTNLYFGEKILVKKEEAADQRYALNINIPLDKTSAYNLREKALKFLRIIGNVLAKIKWPSIGLGTLLAVFLTWTDFSILHLVILELYLILILYETYRLLAKSRPYGLVMDEDKAAIDLAVVRFNQNKKIIATSISSSDGKFTTQVNPGEYNLLAKKSGFFETEKRSIPIKSSRKLEKLDLILKKARREI